MIVRHAGALREKSLESQASFTGETRFDAWCVEPSLWALLGPRPQTRIATLYVSPHKMNDGARTRRRGSNNKTNILIIIDKTRVVVESGERESSPRS